MNEEVNVMEFMYLSKVPNDPYDRPIMQISGIGNGYCAYLFPDYWKYPGASMVGRALLYLPSNHECSSEELFEFFRIKFWDWKTLADDGPLAFHEHVLVDDCAAENARDFIREIYELNGEVLCITPVIEDFIHDVDKWYDKYYG